MHPEASAEKKTEVGKGVLFFVNVNVEPFRFKKKTVMTLNLQREILEQKLLLIYSAETLLLRIL